MLKYLLEKEFKLMLRHSFLPKIIVIFPCIMMLVLPWAANLEIKNINLVVVDRDHSPHSERLTRKMEASEYFHLREVLSSYPAALERVEEGTADVIVEIPPRFERDLLKDGKAGVSIAANAVNGTKGGMSSSYLSAIISDFAGELRAEAGIVGRQSVAPVIEIVTQSRFNPYLSYKVFMIPALMVMLMTMLCGFLPCLNIVSEKESGTIEQMNVSPVGKFTFILAKLLPYWIVGFLVLTLCFGLARWIYGIVPVGSLFTIYFFATLFVLGISGAGLVISNYSNAMQQAMLVMFFFMMIFLLMSGLFTPIKSMPEWAQGLAIFNPLKYFIQVMRMVYLKGSGITDLVPQLIAIAIFAVTFNLWAVLSYRKRS